MKNLIFILSLSGILFTAAHNPIFAFPDMRKFPHDDLITTDGLNTKISKEENIIVLRKMKAKDLLGLYGFCEITKEHIFIFDETMDLKDQYCVISSKGDFEDPEVSSDFMEIDDEDGTPVNYYAFGDEGRVMTLESEGKIYAVWQSWVK